MLFFGWAHLARFCQQNSLKMTRSWTRVSVRYLWVKTVNAKRSSYCSNLRAHTRSRKDKGIHGVTGSTLALVWPCWESLVLAVLKCSYCVCWPVSFWLHMMTNSYCHGIPQEQLTCYASQREAEDRGKSLTLQPQLNQKPSRLLVFTER